MLGEGVEPSLLAEQDPKSCASANFATRAIGELSTVLRGKSNCSWFSRHDGLQQREIGFGEAVIRQLRCGDPTGGGYFAEFQRPGDVAAEEGVQAHSRVGVVVFDNGAGLLDGDDEAGLFF